MSCSCAKVTDEYHGYECTVSGGACMFFIPDSKRCAKEYGEGPDAIGPDDIIQDESYDEDIDE